MEGRTERAETSSHKAKALAGGASPAPQVCLLTFAASSQASVYGSWLQALTARLLRLQTGRGQAVRPRWCRWAGCAPSPTRASGQLPTQPPSLQLRALTTAKTLLGTSCSRGEWWWSVEATTTTTTMSSRPPVATATVKPLMQTAWWCFIWQRRAQRNGARKGVTKTKKAVLGGVLASRLCWHFSMRSCMQPTVRLRETCTTPQTAA
mmetsp:Transcript_16583/g.33848  ORF Transcript_16583/g.33848 Transcript_16583/m.33848 type:complete len:207 (+) Transcript_16583:724-1344(+)